MRALPLILVALLTVLAGVAVTWNQFDSSIEVWFLDDDPAILSYERFQDTFGSDQVVVAAWEDPELWTVEGLRFLHDFTEALAGVEHVARARSLTTAPEVLAEPGVLTLRSLYDPQDPPDPLALKERVLGDDLYAGNLVSVDGRYPAIVLELDRASRELDTKGPLADALDAVAQDWGRRRGVEVTITGALQLDEDFTRYSQRDMTFLLPAMALVIVLTVLGMFGTWRALPLPMAVVGLAGLWTAGVMGAAGIKTTVIHSAIFPLLLGVGIASSVHVLNRYRLLRSQGQDIPQATDGALKQMLPPCLWTSLTTVAGLASLGTSNMSPIREFGVLGGVGVLFAFVLTFVLGRPLLPYVEGLRGGAAGADGPLDRLLIRGAEDAQRRPWVVLGVSLLGVGLSLLGLARLEVGANALDYFKDGAPIRDDIEFVDEHLAGTGGLEVLVEASQPDVFKDPVLLHKLREVQDFMDGVDGVGESVSLADYVAELRRLVRGGDPSFKRIPDTRAEVAQLLLMLDDPEDLEKLVDFDFQRARVRATVKISQMRRLTSRVPELEELLDRTFTGDVTASATGMSKLIHNGERYVLSSMIRSLSLAFVTVLVFMMFALRSVKLGLFSMIPNILPIAAVLGLMGWLDIALDPGTAMTGAVALGLVVDDTVHFLHQFRHRVVELGEEQSAAIEHTLRSSGRAIVMTSVILMAAFWVLTLASFRPNISFGLLCGIAIGLALLADLIVLPAALAALKPKISA